MCVFFLPFIFIVSGGGIALKSMQVNGANVITINFFVVSCLKGDYLCFIRMPFEIMINWIIAHLFSVHQGKLAIGIQAS